jgi:hypothetical protein
VGVGVVGLAGRVGRRDFLAGGAVAEQVPRAPGAVALESTTSAPGQAALGGRVDLARGWHTPRLSAGGDVAPPSV